MQLCCTSLFWKWCYCDTLFSQKFRLGHLFVIIWHMILILLFSISLYFGTQAKSKIVTKEIKKRRQTRVINDNAISHNENYIIIRRLVPSFSMQTASVCLELFFLTTYSRNYFLIWLYERQKFRCSMSICAFQVLNYEAPKHWIESQCIGNSVWWYELLERWSCRLSSCTFLGCAFWIISP